MRAHCLLALVTVCLRPPQTIVVRQSKLDCQVRTTTKTEKWIIRIFGKLRRKSWNKSMASSNANLPDKSKDFVDDLESIEPSVKSIDPELELAVRSQDDLADLIIEPDSDDDEYEDTLEALNEVIEEQDEFTAIQNKRSSNPDQIKDKKEDAEDEFKDPYEQEARLQDQEDERLMKGVEKDKQELENRIKREEAMSEEEKKVKSLFLKDDEIIELLLVFHFLGLVRSICGLESPSPTSSTGMGSTRRA